MKRSTFLTTIGSESAIFGFWLAMKQAELRDDPRSPIVHLMHSLGSPAWASAMILIGLIAMIIGLLNLHRLWLDRVSLSALAGIWLIYTAAFAFQAFDFGHIDEPLIFCAYNFIMICVEAYGSGDDSS